MKSDDVSLVESLLRELESCTGRLRSEIRTMGDILKRLSDTVNTEQDLLRIVSKDLNRWSSLTNLVDDILLVRQIRRRLPHVEQRLLEEEATNSVKEDRVLREAEDVRASFEDILQKFLRR